MSRALEAAVRLQDGLADGEVDWGWVLASALMIGAYYSDRDPLPETGPLAVAVGALIAGAAPGSGLEPETRRQWALEARVLGGMLEERPVIADSDLPDLSHPALLTAAWLSSEGGQDRPALTGPYQELLVAASQLDQGGDRQAALDAYAEAMRAVLLDPDASSYEVATLGYARGALTRLLMRAS